MERNSRIYVAGHRGLVGSAVCRELAARGYARVATAARAELDLRDRAAADRFFAAERPEYVVLAAAKVGGILANDTYPADFLSDNLAIQTNVIEASRQTGARRLLFLGSSCIYPKFAPQPIREESLLTGPLEPTNRAYALAKIAGVEMCRASNRQYGTRFLAAMPTNLYGPEDNFDLQTSHVLPALLRKVAEAHAAGRPEVEVWGTGTPRRELMHSADMAGACVFLLNLGEERYGGLLEAEAPLVNIGTGQDVSIRELAETICAVVGYRGALRFDASKPDGTPRKLLDGSRMAALGWRARIGLLEGIERTWRAFGERFGERPTRTVSF